MRFGNKLYWLTQLFTLWVMGLFIGDFFARGTHPIENNFVVFYLALLSAYAADKEIGRWAAKKDPSQQPKERKGSWVVTLWALLYGFMNFWAWLYPDWKMPEGMARAVISVIGIFFGTGISKRFCGMLRPEGTLWAEPEMKERERIRSEKAEKAAKDVEMQQDMEAVEKCIRASRDGVAVREIVKATEIPRRSATRYLAMLSEQKRIRQIGDGRSTKYVSVR